MDSHPSLAQQQGHYRYDPASLSQGGPARLFPYAGQDGLLRHVFTELNRNLLERGQMSAPWTLFLQALEKTNHTLEEGWAQVSTLLVDLEIFQSDLFNFHLPPGEQFNVDFVRQRRHMAEVLMAAKRSAKHALQASVEEGHSPVQQADRQRQAFYQALVDHDRSGPAVMRLHERDGGLADREFARQRLAGPNPTSIRQVTAQDRERLQAWQTGHSYTLATGQSLNLLQAADQGRLFLLEYPLLDHLTPADLQAGRYVGSPRALFYRAEAGLEPILIQLEVGGTIVTPTAGEAWERSKLYVQCADVTYHELITHLGYTHLAMEAFAIATPRQLPCSHPLYQLLRPHFRFLLAINTRGNAILLGEGAAIDQLLAPTRPASLTLINQAYREKPFADYALPRDIQKRGVGSEVLPDYPYRDDAQLLWDAIHRYVTAFLSRYYQGDGAIQGDPHLQAWAAELGAPLGSRPPAEFPEAPAWMPPEWLAQTGLEVSHLPDHPRVPEFPNASHPGQITSLQQLIEIATLVIFTCGPQHAAVNFSQFDYFGYPPNTPFAVYARPGSQAAFMPSPAQEEGQIALSFALSGIRWGNLGSEKLIQFSDRDDQQILAQFQADLQEIEAKIQERNHQRLTDWGIDYPYLLPSRVPNSINI